MSETQLVAPFPYFGGKRRAVGLVWQAFGSVDNYVEPFCGSMAMLLGSPVERRIETVNDSSGFLVNFWRAVQQDPESVAAWADWPVTEIDLEARHGWLVNRTERLRWSLQDPDYYDAKIAGWWVWGCNAWIGSGWCMGRGPWVSNGATISNIKQQAGSNAGRGINRQLPHVADAGRGINRKLPHVGDERSGFILDWFTLLSNRLRDVRIACGDWSRVVSGSVTTMHGITAVFLDPPYSSEKTKMTTGLYESEGEVSSQVRDWCLANGGDPKLRIVLCGYTGEHDMPGWRLVAGRATNGGYGNSGELGNHKREALWLSPHCVTTAEVSS